MTEPRFNVVFDGKLLPGIELETAKQNLATLFKSEIAAIERLFSGSEVALKRDLPQDDAQKYLAALNGAGIDARLQEQPGLSLDLAEVAQPAPAPRAQEPASPYAPPQTQLDRWATEVGELNVLSAKGRIGRLRYLAWTMVLMLIAMPIIAICAVMASVSEVLSGILTVIAVIAMVVVSVMIGIQRLHDIGWSGWLMLVNLVPIANTVFSIMMMAMPGTPGTNVYGAPPPENSTSVKVLAWIWFGLIILGLLFIVIAIVGGGLALLGTAMKG